MFITTSLDPGGFEYSLRFLSNCYQVNATTPHWSLVNNGSGNGLVPSGAIMQEAITWANVDLDDTSIERVYNTKFLGVHIDSQLSWKKQIDYTCKKLSKCVTINSKARKKLYKPSLIMLYYSFAYPYFMHCNHVWGNNYPANVEKLVLVQKKLVRIITNFHFGAHSEPLLYADRLLTISDINEYVVGMFMYRWVNENLP